MAEWTFLTNHARALLLLAEDPGARLRDIGAALGVTERSAFAIVADLAEAGYVVKHKDGRRNRYRVVTQMRLPDPVGRDRTIGDMLEVLVGDRAAGKRRTK